jgi:hypothetical protein
MSGVYQLVTDPNTVLRLADNAFIPFEGANRDYQEYLAWLADGNTPDPLPPLTRAEEAARHLEAGLTVNFPNDAPGLGTYAVLGAAAQNLNSLTTNYNENGRFPGNQTIVGIFDVDHNMHLFTKQAFIPFIQAVSDFVHFSHLYVEGESLYLPPNSVTLSGLVEVYTKEDLVGLIKGLEARVAALEKGG